MTGSTKPTTMPVAASMDGPGMTGGRRRRRTAKRHHKKHARRHHKKSHKKHHKKSAKRHHKKHARRHHKKRGGSVVATAALPFGLLALQKFFQTRKGRKDLKKASKTVKRTVRRATKTLRKL